MRFGRRFRPLRRAGGKTPAVDGGVCVRDAICFFVCFHFTTGGSRKNRIGGRRGVGCPPGQGRPTVRTGGGTSAEAASRLGHVRPVAERFVGHERVRRRDAGRR